MNSIRKVIAALMVAVLTVAMASTAAFAVEEENRSDELVALAKDALEDIDTDDLYTGTIDDPILVYYGSQPFTQAFTLLKWLTSNDKRNQPDFTGSIQDLSVGIVSDLAGFYAKNWASKTLTTLKDASSDIADGLETGPDKVVKKVSKVVPVASDIYELSGPAGKMAMQAVLFPGYLATNAGALAFVLVGGGAALVVIFGLSGILSPLLALKEGPRIIEQLFRDINEMEHAVQAAK